MDAAIGKPMNIFGALRLYHLLSLAELGQWELAFTKGKSLVPFYR